MDMSGSGRISGCESGWTVYLDESYNPRNDHDYTCYSQSYGLNSTRADEEDLSMVSDASSGPRHYDGQNCRSSSRVKLSKKSGDKRSKGNEKNKLSEQQPQQQSFNSNLLDDTASSSSPAITTYSKMYENSYSCNQTSIDHYVNFPRGVSEAHFQGEDGNNQAMKRQ